MMDDGTIAVLQIMATVLLNLSLAGMIGIYASRICLQRSTSSWVRSLDRPLSVAWFAAILLALLASGVTLWLEATSMAGVSVFEAWLAVRSVLETTHYGHVWLFGASALLVVLVSSTRLIGGKFSAGAQLIVGTSLAIFALSRTLVSHAVINGDATWAVAVDWIHLVLISLWVGEVLVAGFIVLNPPIGDEPAGRTDAAMYVNSLSTSATVALSGIVLTGLLNAARGIGTVGNLMGNQYCDVLLVKLALVGLAVILGGLNRFRVMPELLGAFNSAEKPFAKPQRAFVQILKLEAVVLVAVTIAAAILSATAPPTAM